MLFRSVSQSRYIQSNQEQQLNPITFQEFYDIHYLPYINTHIKSYETNISVFKNHILNHLANTKMVELKKATVMQLHSNMLHIKNLSPATANKFLIFLSNAYSLAHQFDLLPNEINPCRGVKEFELNNQRQIFLSKAQAKRLLSEVEISPNIHLKYIIPMLLLTGARKREVLDATWSDFDMLNNLWAILLVSSFLPITGSTFLFLASSVRSTVNSSMYDFCFCPPFLIFGSPLS